ncbi:helix-turn-helix domain-containing protein [Bacillus sp. RO1]|uniref:helix-turn-helix domain-containing protein n=1 Tax=Bacillus sp. RO1 TaxID=2722703 RepID=UPI001456ED1F|nr:helix-turn-helix domain-containing protein [Bacillus sp. RO1]NLP51286.1 helix-turn-helix domain-containing protein [Bacillus sp. RO1]
MKQQESKQQWTPETMFHKVHLSFYTSGLANLLGASKTATLMGLASYMDEKGVAYPTQKQLADRTGISERTIHKNIKELLDLRINGKPILTAKKYRTDSGHYNYVYVLHPISQITKFEGGEIEKIEPILKKPEQKEENEREKAIKALLG